MHIDKYRKPDGSYEDPGGCCYESAGEFLQTSVLGFCGCGRPEDSLAYVRDVLQHIDNVTDVAYEEWKSAGKKLFATDGAAYFAFYVMDSKGMTEHGGSVPGWLTDQGREMLEDLNEYLANRQ